MATETIRLYHRSGRIDKVYNIYVEEMKPLPKSLFRYQVRVEWGKNGEELTSRVKKSRMGQAEAQNLAWKIEQEKRNHPRTPYLAVDERRCAACGRLCECQPQRVILG